MDLSPSLISAIVTTLVVAFILVIAYLLLNMEKHELNESTRAKLPGRFVSLTEGAVHYEISPQTRGTTIVLVHGFSVPAHIWDPTFEGLNEAGFRVMRYDLFGRGYSDRPSTRYDIGLFTRQLEGLLDALGISDPVHLVGLSMGGPVTASFAVQHPQRVSKLCFIDPLVSPILSRQTFPIHLRAIGDYLMAIFIAPFILPKSQKNDFFKPENYPEWIKRYKEQMKYKGFRRAILSTLRNFSTPLLPIYKALESLNITTMLIWGEADKTIPYEEIQKLRAAVPGMAFHAIERAGHLPHYERPEIVTPLLVEYFKSE